MVMRDEHLMELDQADARAKKLPLSAFAAVDQETIPSATNEKACRSTLRRRHRAGRPKEDDIEIHRRL